MFILQKVRKVWSEDMEEEIVGGSPKQILGKLEKFIINNIFLI